MSTHQLKILGTGTSTGVPIPGCECSVCLSEDSKNKRLRTSAHIIANNKHFQIDTGPDLRFQVLKNKIKRIDHVFLTHDHADHLHGIDDLRPFCFHQKANIPVCCNTENFDSITKRFPYIFQADTYFNKDRPILGGGIPRLNMDSVELDFTPKAFEFLGEEFFLFNMPHGHTKTIGICHGKMAYLVDCHSIPKEVVNFLKERKLEWLIIDCLKPDKHQTHLDSPRTFEYIRQIAPQNAGLIHMAHYLSHEQWIETAKSEVGDHVIPLYDGQILSYGS